MRIRKISKEHLFGRFYVKKHDANVWDCYYNTLENLRPLLEDKDFNRIVSGFYINYNYKTKLTRITYFVSEASGQKAVSIFQNFFMQNEIVEAKCEPPRKKSVVNGYGGEELEEAFRYFLNLETQIGLELIKAGLLHARRLFATYCLQVRKGKLPVREHFEPSLTKRSPTFASLSQKEKERFFSDLEKVGWAHMMVNFVLGCDVGPSDMLGKVIIDGVALSIPEINETLRAGNIGFQVPLDWQLGKENKT